MLNGYFLLIVDFYIITYYLHILNAKMINILKLI